ncbi:MAG: hypothetical protein K2O84_06700 [Oscillospiraceae bacterium]|nr:hypothetical protein [Oscillospiraceae bacterium]
MRAILIINNVDFTPWLMSEGLQQTEIIRRRRSVVAINGIEYRLETVKRGLSVSLVELRDVSWYRLLDALSVRPATVRYIDDRLGDCTKLFYVTGPSAAAKAVRGGHTYFSGGVFSLEEK